MSDEEQQGEERDGGRGRIGVEIYEQVEQLVKEHGISRTEAFQRLSDETGRRAGTVAANYYRIARQRVLDASSASWRRATAARSRTRWRAMR